MYFAALFLILILKIIRNNLRKPVTAKKTIDKTVWFQEVCFLLFDRSINSIIALVICMKSFSILKGLNQCRKGNSNSHLITFAMNIVNW